MTDQQMTVPAGITLFTNVSDYRAWRRQAYLDNKVVGFVPTMGALHQGHLDLVAEAQRDCDEVVVSIFVNPAQFAPHEDLDTYPRTLQTDLDRLASVASRATVLVPRVSEMYPNGIDLDVTKQQGAFVSVHGLSHQLEGVTRPHFFRGVATVVSKLFNIIQPEHAYFGQKDIQQCFVIQRLISDLHFPIQLHRVLTTREADGLAKSSRNTYLTPSQRQRAIILYKVLQHMKDMYFQGEHHAPTLIKVAQDMIEAEREDIDKTEDWTISLDYISINSGKDLSEIRGEIPNDKEGFVISMAVYVDKTRLIDNFIVGAKE